MELLLIGFALGGPLVGVACAWRGGPPTLLRLGLGGAAGGFPVGAAVSALLLAGGVPGSPPLVLCAGAAAGATLGIVLGAGAYALRRLAGGPSAP